MKTTVIIPARYASTRLPGKPILPEVKRITGKHFIQHCYERAEAAPGVSEVMVATDDRRIMRAVEGFGGNATMTDPSHTCGTDRIAEVAAEMECDVVVNIQGDEPEIQPEQITYTIELLEEDQNADMGTLAHPIEDEKTWHDPNAVKVVTDRTGRALYFSRSPIPHVRDSEDWLSDTPFRPLKHMGIYSFRREFLLSYAAMEPCELEKAEKLEQLRALNAGHLIQVGITETPTMGIDTPADLEQWLSQWQ